MQGFVPLIHQILRNARLVEDPDVLGVDSRALVERGEDFLELHRTEHRMLTIAVGRAITWPVRMPPPARIAVLACGQ